jgi:hypothetical protein
MTATERTAAIRALNDQFRRKLNLGSAFITVGVAALGAEAVARIVLTIASFDAFSEENDPWDERDFGAFDAAGQRIFFKIDYYDNALEFHSPDPSDVRMTKRVITVMLASEY